MIPVSVIVVTRNEEAHIGRCLAALGDFAEVVVVDSGSSDDTQRLAQAAGAQVVNFEWNGQYPKKRQWCLDHLPLKYDWVFFVDADEIVSDDIVRELQLLFAQEPDCAGYFVRGQYVVNGRRLRFGLQNNKLCLLDRRKMMFPEIDDIGVPGMGEIEGHYQPVFRGGESGKIGQIYRAEILHFAYDRDWSGRHQRYAAWERGMNLRNAWPQDPVRWRQVLKQAFRNAPARGPVAFVHSYVLKLGFLDGATGLAMAKDRMRYYRMIAKEQDNIEGYCHFPRRHTRGSAQR